MIPALLVGMIYLWHYSRLRRRVYLLERKIWLGEYEKLPWELREPGASDIGSRIPLARRLIKGLRDPIH